jgi:hypothetical protein
MKVNQIAFWDCNGLVDLSIKSSGNLEVGGRCLLGVGVRGCPKMMALGVAWMLWV